VITHDVLRASIDMYDVTCFAFNIRHYYCTFGRKTWREMLGKSE